MLELRLGDFVEVNLGAEDDETEDHFGVMQIAELFEDIQVSLHIKLPRSNTKIACGKTNSIVQLRLCIRRRSRVMSH